MTDVPEVDRRQLLKRARNVPGVYVMFDEKDDCLYVGKVKSLKNRLSSYFRKTGLPAKTAHMMERVCRIDTHLTHTESEALLLEINLIKELKPRYNVVFRDDRTYPYIRVGTDHQFPGLGFYRGNRKGPGRYLGPFSSAGAVRSSLTMVQKVIPVRQCEDSYFRNRSRPCLQHQIGRCTAPCVGFIDPGAYDEDVTQTLMLLEGKDAALGDRLTQKMEVASKGLDFENAALWRDRLQSLRQLQSGQVLSGTRQDVDVIVGVEQSGVVCLSVMSIRNGQNTGGRQYLHRPRLDESLAQVVEAFLPQYYLVRPIPREIVVAPAVTSAQAIVDFLAEQCGRQVMIKSKVRSVRARWLETTRANALDYLARLLSGDEMYEKGLAALAATLGITTPMTRLECYDVSHTQGEAAMGSCVVFDASGAARDQYRRFSLRDIQAGDDYAGMDQMLRRRFRGGASADMAVPDLLLIDGGRGQLNVAVNVLNELSLGSVRVMGVAKGRDRKPGRERLYLSGRRSPVVLDPTSPALHLVQQMRDEAHRFAISGHRAKRGRARTTSALEGIPGVGSIRRRALLRHFGGLRQVQSAGIDDLLRVSGISRPIAQRVYDYLHQG